ncbi:chromophore lyase CpcT/CpeT [Pantanalinema rosaneae CENA516]|uniref:chromophore lyase CpcT/CpeT n=1 Tax=Pantanalinema rosaneae TaxID=1620701 RepID=UPI003D6ECAEB
MKRQRLIGLCLGLTWSAIATATQADSPRTLSTQEQVADIAARLEGVMTTSAQATKNPKAPHVQMTTCRIQVVDAPSDKTNSTIFLYQEQALAQKLTQPYRQRFLQVAPAPDRQQIESRSFKPEQPSDWVGLCNKPLSERRLTLKQLGTPICSVFLQPSQQDYIGSTPDQGCPTNVRGAVKITNQIMLYPDGMDTWDRGFDASGKQVWGAEGESYQYRKPKGS